MKPPAVLRPVWFELDDTRDRFLFCDAFIAFDHTFGRCLVLVTTYYPDVSFDFGEVVVTLDGSRLNQFEDLGRDEHEPMRAVVYPLAGHRDLPSHALEVRYAGQTVGARLSPERPPSRPVFTLATLFKDDFAQVETCYRHYKKQGVDRFLLFYNGLLSKLPRALFAAPEIVYGEWPFRYWLSDQQVAGKKQHHAQSMFLTMIRYRFLPQSSYLALVDLDEFLAVRGDPSTKVRDHIESLGEECLSARMYWAEVRRPKSPRPTDITHADLGHVWANPRHEGDARMKTIYRGDFGGLCGVHRPKEPARTEVCDMLALYHVTNAHHGRQSLISPDAVPVPL